LLLAGPSSARIRRVRLQPGGCEQAVVGEVGPRKELQPARFPTMLTGVHRRPPPSAACANTLKVTTSEQRRTGVNETKTEPRPGRAAWPADRLPGTWPVSVEAISWALNLAPVLADRGGQPSSVCKFVRVGVADHAGRISGFLPSLSH
jgi:hypothetical protein